MPLSKHKITREDYTNIFRKELQDSDLDEETIDVLIMNLWQNSMRTGGLRVTKRGFDMLDKNIMLESWKLDVDEGVSINELLVMLDKHLDSPYFIHPRSNAPANNESYYYSVSIFSEKVAMAAGLMGLYHYLTVEEKRKKHKKTS